MNKLSKSGCHVLATWAVHLLSLVPKLVCSHPQSLFWENKNLYLLIWCYDTCWSFSMCASETLNIYLSYLCYAPVYPFYSSVRSYEYDLWLLLSRSSHQYLGTFVAYNKCYDLGQGPTCTCSIFLLSLQPIFVLCMSVICLCCRMVWALPLETGNDPGTWTARSIRYQPGVCLWITTDT